MSAYAKIAVTVPTAMYEQMERVRRQLGKSRSSAVTLALQEWLRSLEMSDADRRYVEAYLQQPERIDEVRAVAAQATAHWEPWAEDRSQAEGPSRGRRRGDTRRRASR